MKKTKNLCIIYTENDYIIKAIDEYFKDSEDITITCLFSEEKNLSNYIYKKITKQSIRYENISEYLTSNKFDLVVTFNYTPEFSRETYDAARFIKIHHSILPAFPEQEAVQNAFLAGVKVSGITIHSLEKDSQNNKIIAQYPVLISSIMHFEEFKQSIENLEINISPIVISKLLENKLFDFQDLLSEKKHSCNGNCGSCGNCSPCH